MKHRVNQTPAERRVFWKKALCLSLRRCIDTHKGDCSDSDYEELCHGLSSLFEQIIEMEDTGHSYKIQLGWQPHLHNYDNEDLYADED